MPTILLLCGSSRAASINQVLLEAAASMAPPDIKCIDTVELGQLPPYNQDLDADPPPAAVARLRQDVARADGLLIATPEYNHSIPGAVKTAIDWASRPRGAASLSGKAVVVLVATMGAGFGFQCHGQMRALLSDLGNFVVPSPLIVVQRAGEKLRRGLDQKAVWADQLGHRLMAANWAALSYAIQQGAGKICLYGSEALAQMPKT